MPRLTDYVHVACTECANYVDNQCRAGFNPGPETTHLAVRFCDRFDDRRKHQHRESP